MTKEEKMICKDFLNDADKTHSCNEYKLLMALLEQEPNAPTYNEWIYRTMPEEGVDFNKIEKALGFKLFIWQKTFITRGVFRQYGATTAMCIRRLLQKDNPIDYRKRIVHAQELFERQEMIRIHDQLQAAGVEVCEILRPERKK